MDAVGEDAARRRLSALMDQLCADRAPVVITRERGRPVVLISLEDYESLQQAAGLLRSHDGGPARGDVNSRLVRRSPLDPPYG